jgi:integrase
VARSINRLTANSVKAITKPGLHADGGGLYLRVEESGAKRWAFLYRLNGRRKEMGLGSVLSLSLASARRAAQEAREQVQAGDDPVEIRRGRRASESPKTFGQCADELIKALSPGWKNHVHREQWVTTLSQEAAALRDKPVASITTADVLEVLKPIWQTKSETASRLRGRIERVLDAAKVQGQRDGENPARWRGHLAHLLPKRSYLTRGHHAAMPIDDMPAFMAKLRAREGLSVRALEFTILTVSRTNESLGVRAEEIDLFGATWTVPKERMGKTKQPHRVPLCDRATEIVREHWPEGGRGLLFPGRGKRRGKTLSENTMLSLLDHMGYGQYTVHGFRSTFEDWVGDRTEFSEELAEMSLAHTIKSKVRRAYRRGDALEKRRFLIEQWSLFVNGQSPVANVVKLRA